jgi:DNA polymerase-3 subunit delta'
MLRRAVEKGRVAHAWLFVGRDPAAKLALVRELAKALMCERGGPDPCDECRACTRIDHSNHPDVEVFRPEEGKRDFSIEIVKKELIRRMGFRPLEGDRKVFYAESADRMSLEAQNAMLKTLEEPPDGSILVLGAAEPARLVSTIRSRVQTLVLAGLGTDELANELAAKWGLEAEAAAFYARLAHGNEADASHAVSNDYRSKWDWCAKVLAEHALDANFARASELVAMADAACPSNAKAIAKRAELLRLLGLLGTVARDALADAAGADKRLLIGPQEGTITGEWDTSALVRAAVAVAETSRDVLANANRPLAVENLMTRLATIAARGRGSSAAGRGSRDTQDAARPSGAERRGR